MKMIQKIKKLYQAYAPLCADSQCFRINGSPKLGEERQVRSPPHLIKQKIVKEYARRFALDTLIETGTYLGQMVLATKNTFKEIFSIELDNRVFERAKKKFARYPYITYYPW